jgi:uncharacterized protein DUF6777
VIVLVVLIAVGAVVAFSGGSNDSAGASPGVQRELVTSAGTNPFMPSVAAAPPSATTPTTTIPPTNGTVASFTGSTPGLYGGTLNNQVCDVQQLVNFLTANPQKGAAWAGVLGIRQSDIPSYVATLTPLILRADTRVTNHGFANGQATELQSVLQAGTAVLVDQYGVPRVRCYCGNPLLPPRLTVTRYEGPTWPGFSPNTLVVIEKSTTVINNFTAVDVTTGQPISVPAGSKVTAPSGGSGSNTTTTAATTTTTSAPAQPTDVTSDGSGSASSITSGYPASLALDGNPATSWFSLGVKDPAGSETSVFTWTASKDHQITGIQLVGNGANSNPSFRSGFGFGSATIEVLNSFGGTVFTQEVSFPNGDPNTNVSLNALGKVVRITFHHHQSPDCGGFAELHVLATS